MKLEIKDVTSKDAWEGFMAQVRPPTFLHAWNWADFNQAMGETVYRWGIYDAQVLHGLALIIKIKAKRGSFLFCPHGPILDGDVSNDDAYTALVEKLKKVSEQENCSFARISPLLADTPENREVFKKLGAREAPLHMHPELAWILDLSSSEDELLKAMRKATRYSIRKAESSGVEVEISHEPSDVGRFNRLYLSTVNRQHFTPFPKDYLETEFRTFLRDGQAALIFGRYNGEDISGAFVVYYNGSGFYHHGASNQKYPQVPASYLVQWRAIQEAKRRGCESYNFWGISPDDQPHHPWAGLSLFKKGFGGHAEAYVHAKDFVFSPRYWITYAIEKVRKAKRHL